MVDNRVASKAAIIVDWDLYRSLDCIREWVDRRRGQSRMVLLVEDPFNNDYDPAEHESEWDAVIRNTGKLKDVAFKATATDVLFDVSNLTPVIAIDITRPDMTAMYREAGVLVTWEDLGIYE